MSQHIIKRGIKSYVKRQGRMTKAQKAALTHMLPIWGITPSQGALDYEVLFGNKNPVILEIGFGMGASLIELAINNPGLNYIGVEVHEPGVGVILQAIEQHGITNLRVAPYDVNEILNNNIPDASLDGVQIFFPDPWPKARHHKRRLIQISFVELLVRKLASEGFLHLATDWENYAEHMVSVVNEHPALMNQSTAGSFITRPESRPETKYERRGERLGHPVFDLFYVRK